MAGNLLRLRDVGQCDLRLHTFSQTAVDKLGRPAVTVAIFQTQRAMP